MLHNQSAYASDFIAAFDLLANGEETTPFCSAGEPVRPGPMLVPSIAESAGLNRFVYIVGLSEHRYVFSSIQKSQISLYSEAVFVVIGESGALWVGDYSAMISHLNSARLGYNPRIYVHLLAEGELVRSHVISDLSRSVNRHSCWNAA